ncbi:MAG: HAD family hydrolase, partial [Deltaproteobacteria bacterium]
MKNIAVFLDRDGTIIEEVNYLDDLNKIVVYPSSYVAIKMLNDVGIKVIVVTNQSGVARGYFDEVFVKKTHEEIARLMNENGAHIDRFYFCPHHSTEGIGQYRVECDCRKPKTGMLVRAVEEFDIDLKRSFVIGDSITDVEMAHAVGATGILV